MPRRVLVLMIVLVAFLAIFLMVALRRQPPVIPADLDHARHRGNPEGCMSCHGPGRSHPRGPNHPLGAKECGSCHYEAGER